MTNNINVIIARDVNDGAEKRVQVKRESIDLHALPDLDVLVDIDYSSLNYKDALAVSGRAPICRRLPMVCGIDLAGTVIESKSGAWRTGDRVLINGYGLSETQWGGYAQQQRVSADWLVKRPDTISSKLAMAIGTAGYTAMLCVNALRDHGLTPADGPILVTGASGGVGSIALVLLSKLGFTSVAVSGRESAHCYLKSLGASEVVSRDEFHRDSKALERETWAGAIDSVGSKTLACLIAQINYGGIVAACGLAGGADLPASVMPFILRGVTLRGTDSVMASQVDRQRSWQDLAELITMDDLETVCQVEPMSQLPQLANALLKGELQGRIVIDVNA